MPPTSGYGMGIYADDLAALLDALGVDEVVLCGLSMGGYVTFEFLRRWRHRVRALILMDTRAEADSTEGRRARDAAAATAREGGAAAVGGAMLPKMLAAGTRGARAGARRAGPTDDGGHAGRWDGRRARGHARPARQHRPPARRSPASPPWCSWARRTCSTPPDAARRMATPIPGARLVVIPGAGHLPPVERPSETTAAIREFLRVVG